MALLNTTSCFLSAWRELLMLHHMSRHPPPKKKRKGLKNCMHPTLNDLPFMCLFVLSTCFFFSWMPQSPCFRLIKKILVLFLTFNVMFLKCLPMKFPILKTITIAIISWSSINELQDLLLFLLLKGLNRRTEEVAEQKSSLTEEGN